MENSIFCPSCHLRNESDAKYCTFCGASLDPFIRTALTTRELDEKSKQRRQELSQEHLEKVPVGSLGLFILDEENPIIISPDAHELILGRIFENAEDTLLDLTRFGAQQLGVSRRHARIAFMGSSFVIQDLGSTNGTWVNNQRLLSNELCVLRNNDIINLAWLFMTVCLRTQDQEA
jgi:hypothetical protein